MSVCGGWSLVRTNRDTTTAISLWCRSWQCPDCAPKRASGLRRFARDGKPTTFITLTVNPDFAGSPNERASALANAWRLVVKRARRKWIKAPLEFLAIFEKTKAGEPHLHIVARAPYIPQRWLSEQLAELIQAPVVDIRAVKGAKAISAYIAKYVSKAASRFGTCKRYWASPGYNRTPKKPAGEDGLPLSGWRIWKDSVRTIADIWYGLGFQIEYISESEWRHIPGTRHDEATRLRC